MSRPLFAGYPASPADEAVTPDGRPRDDYARARRRPWSGWGIDGPDGRGGRDRRRSATARGVTVGVVVGRPADRAAVPAGPGAAGRPRRASGRAWRPGWSSGTAR